MFGQIETLLALAMGQNLDRSEQISYLLRFSAGRHLVAVRYCLRVFCLSSDTVLKHVFNVYVVFVTKILKNYFTLLMVNNERSLWLSDKHLN